MKDLIKSSIKPAASYWLKTLAKVKINQFRETNDAFDLIKSIRATIDKNISSVEAATIDQIERRRQELLQSSDTFQFKDFGTGLTGDGPKTASESKSVASAASWSRSPFWSLLLFQLLKTLKPQNCLEMGACVGISGSYLAAALNLNGTGGHLTTMEGCTDLADITKETFQKLNLKNAEVVPGLFDDKIVETIKTNGPFDFAYVDGNHSYKATINYFQELKQQAQGKPLTLVFDDIHWTKGMKQAWDEIKNDPTVETSIDLRGFGVCTLNQGRSKQQIVIPIV